MPFLYNKTLCEKGLTLGNKTTNVFDFTPYNDAVYCAFKNQSTSHESTNIASWQTNVAISAIF